MIDDLHVNKPETNRSESANKHLRNRANVQFSLELTECQSHIPQLDLNSEKV